MPPTLGTLSLPGYSPTYQGAWTGARNAQQQQIGLGTSYLNQLMANQQATQAGINAGYGSLSSAVLHGLHGANQTNINDINRKFTALSGQASQDLINRGLGNTTIQSSVQTGIAGNRAREVTASRNSFANLLAQYRTQIGEAGLSAQEQGLGMANQLGGMGLGFLSSIGIGYPNPGAYGSSGGMGGLGIPGPQVGYMTGGYGGPVHGPTVEGMPGGGGDQWMGYGALNAPSWTTPTSAQGGGGGYMDAISGAGGAILGGGQGYLYGSQGGES